MRGTGAPFSPDLGNGEKARDFPDALRRFRKTMSRSHQTTRGIREVLPRFPSPYYD